MFDLLVAALPEKNLSEVMDIIPAINPFKVLKQQVAAVQPKKKQFKKKTGGGGGFSGGPAAGCPVATAAFSLMQSRPGWDSAYASSTSATELEPPAVPRTSPDTGR